MDKQDGRTEGYVVPTYLAAEDTPFYHFLHGSVPGHQIDFIYHPAVPQGSLSRQHFGHLARVIKFVEPREHSPYAFTIANLSRDDTQHEPGHGGLALIFGLRIRGATDHAGRRDPPFSHAVAAINRDLDAQTILGSALAFYRGLFPGDKAITSLGDRYHHYAQCVAEYPENVPAALDAYIADFAGLPQPEPSKLSRRWTVDNAPPPKRIVILHDRDTLPFETLAGCAARIAAMLYVSDIRWTSITTGREADLPGGVAIRFVPRRDANLGETDAMVLPIEQVPQNEGEIAARLFGAVAVEPAPKPKAMARWREQIGPAVEPTSGTSDRPPEPPQKDDSPPAAPFSPDTLARPPAGGPIMPGNNSTAEPVKHPRSRRFVWIGLVVLGAAGAVMASFAATSDKPPMDLPAPLPSGAAAVKAAPSAQPASGAPVPIASAVTSLSSASPPVSAAASPAPIAPAPPVAIKSTSPAPAPPSGKRPVSKPAPTNDEVQMFDAPLDLAPNHEPRKP